MLAWTDVGMATMTEMVWVARNICNAINVPLISDADTGYDALYRSGRIIEVACWAHARRRFVEALDPGSGALPDIGCQCDCAAAVSR